MNLLKCVLTVKNNCETNDEVPHGCVEERRTKEDENGGQADKLPLHGNIIPGIFLYYLYRLCLRSLPSIYEAGLSGNSAGLSGNSAQTE